MVEAKKIAKSVVFVHPDLGIGGAERLVIDAAVGLQSQGHKVTIFTSYCNKTHCFEEARDGTLDVRVRGDSIFPSSIAGRLNILCAILRQLSLVASTSIFSTELSTVQPDVFFVDQLSACVPFLRLLFPRARILFYCHYPDKLLIRQEAGLIAKVKGIYRVPFDAFEGWSTACSDAVVVNSKYTRSVVKQTFASLKKRELRVVYPCVDTSAKSAQSVVDSSSEPWSDKKLLLSINRFERKKNLALAVKAFAGLSHDERSKARLVLAGGYDPRNVENAAALDELKDLASSLDINHATLTTPTFESGWLDPEYANTGLYFALSVPSDLRDRLLRSASILIYTPTNEHFGIVPLEAMLASVPVLATNTGGPLETIYDGRTGWLVSPDKVEKWTDVMRKALIPSSEGNLRTMGERGRERVLNEFSQTKMTEVLDAEMAKLCGSWGARPPVLTAGVIGLLLAVIIALAAAAVAGFAIVGG
ncbi:glycosyltransferase family 4 protein [Polychaeton citri CBS 116435]|uniref:Alpha-1,3/1,6-mannosyltransferase ALG2 n=1 Tax=Polychaeton citri CBS 116435 TaxID=1314669 RepID=A0A9P4PWR8_9PEZI|nr:glycosyltransferase family 4 protein [Polychaeton citri CBS 116435]